MQRISLVTFVVLGILALGMSAWALPPCNQVNTYVECNATCSLFGWGSCQGYELVISPTCEVIYYCTWRTTHMPCSCGFGCFVAGTEISMADGSVKPIQEIEVGNMVLAYDEETGELKPDQVSLVHDPVEWAYYFVVNGNLKLTPQHPVLSDGEWVEIGKLEVGDTMTGADGSAVTIESIETIKETVTVYNFATNPYETYIANGIIVHNKPPIPTEP